MSEQNIRDLWDAVGEVRKETVEIKSLLIELKAGLAERCVARGRSLELLERDVEMIKTRVWFITGAAAAISALATKLVARLWP
jgi:hypothetical protein